ncbi:hypothetical protein KR018_010361, partial [Drosophila ironensis]
SENFSKFTLANLASLPSTLSVPQASIQMQLNVGPMEKYSARVIDDILNDIFAERRGEFPETSSSCHLEPTRWPASSAEPHVDKRLRYWKDMLQERRKIQQRVQDETGKLASEVLFNRRSTLDSRDEQTMKRLLDYADRMQGERLTSLAEPKIGDYLDPCTCELVTGPTVTHPTAERKGYKEVEIVGLPEVVKQEMLGKDALAQKVPPGWMQSDFLDERIEQNFISIKNVLEFFPDLDNLQVTGTNVSKLRPVARTTLKGVDSMHTVTNSTAQICSEEYTCGSMETTEYTTTETAEPVPVPVPELGLNVNGVDYVPGECGITECHEILTRFCCDPFQRRVKKILQLKNIGRQTLTFSWKQSTYFYNRGSLLLARDNEFLFDLEGFRLAHGESQTLMVLYQPRKVSIAVELWLLRVEPRIFCCRQESLLLRFHGRCTPPKDYMAKLVENQCATECKSDAEATNRLTEHLGDLVPLVVPPPACCPYERPLAEREQFNAENPGYNCDRFDDLEMLRAFHKRIKKPRERPWDLRLTTIKEYVLRVTDPKEREALFDEFSTLIAPLQGPVVSLEKISQLDEQKQRSRFIYVRGVIGNGIAEWEELMFNVEESFYKPELQRFYLRLLSDFEEDAGDEEDANERMPTPMAAIDHEKLVEILEAAELDEDKVRVAVMRKLHHSKYFRDTLYIQTFSHLCNMAEDIVSVIESTEVVPT